MATIRSWQGMKDMSSRLLVERTHESTPLQVSLSSQEDVDSEVLGWLQRAYEQNR